MHRYLLAALAVVVFVCSGCDAGTYNARSKETPTSGAGSDTKPESGTDSDS